MDDHLYDMIMNYGECELIPRFNSELQEQVDVRGCYVIEEAESYKEINNFCKALNAVAPYAGMCLTTPIDFVRLSWEFDSRYRKVRKNDRF